MWWNKTYIDVQYNKLSKINTYHLFIEIHVHFAKKNANKFVHDLPQISNVKTRTRNIDQVLKITLIGA